MSHEILENMRDRLTLAALEHAPFDGWSAAALKHGARDCGFDPTVPGRLFAGGAFAAVEHFTRLADRLMTRDAAERLDLKALKAQERVDAVIGLRLRRWEAHKEAVRRALALYALPAYAPSGVTATALTVDAIWKAAGDRSSDFNWYTKRVSLAAIYCATLLYWLEDSSEDSRETRVFLRDRLSGLVTLIKTRKKITDAVAGAFGELANPMTPFVGAKARNLFL